MITHRVTDRLFLWLGSESHELRIIDAASAVLKTAAAAVTSPEATGHPSSDMPVDELQSSSSAVADADPHDRRVRFQMVLSFLDRRGLLRRLFADPAQYRVFLEAADAPDTKNGDSDLWNELVRRLEVRRVLLQSKSMPAQDRLPSAAVAQTPNQPELATGHAEAPDAQKLARWENAMLGALYERLYGSTPVRVLGLALAAAVLLAGGGVVFIVGQSYSVRNALDATFAQAEQGLRKQVETSQAAISRQSESLRATSEAFARLATEARQEVNSRVQEFRGEAERLKAETSEKVLAALRRDLDAQSSRLRVEIDTGARALQAEISTPLLRARDGATSVVNALHTDVDKMRSRVTVHSVALSGVERQLQEITAVAARSGSVAKAVAQMDEDHKRIEAVSKSVSGVMESVQAKEIEILQLHRRVSEALRFGDRDLIELSKGIGGAQARLVQSQQWLNAKEEERAQFERQAEALGRPLKEVQLLVVEAGKAAQAIADMRAEVGQLCHALGQMEPRRTEANLSQAEWARVQRALIDRNFRIRKIDGNPGKPLQAIQAGGRQKALSETRTAIKLYQASIKAADTGELTGEQIHDLLSLPKTLSCTGFPMSRPGEASRGSGTRIRP